MNNQNDILAQNIADAYDNPEFTFDYNEDDLFDSVSQQLEDSGIFLNSTMIEGE